MEITLALRENNLEVYEVILLPMPQSQSAGQSSDDMADGMKLYWDVKIQIKKSSTK